MSRSKNFSIGLFAEAAPVISRGAAKRGRRRRGAMLIMVAIMLFLFLISVAFTIDLAQMHLSRTELRTASDAAANAAATTLADTLDRGEAIARGQAIAAANIVNGEPLLLSGGDFTFGRSQRLDSGVFRFTGGETPLNGVRVNGRRTEGSRSGAVPLLFGNVTGTNIFEPTVTATAAFIERDIMLVVDRSGSMAGGRIADLTQAITVFQDLLEITPVREHVGLASYSQSASEDLEMTPDVSQLTPALAGLQISGLTNISAGMQAGQRVLNRGRSPVFVERTMIVMTDGQHNFGIEPRVVASQLARERMTLHTITFGAGADIRRMQEVAQIGGGRHFHAISGAQLIAVYREIALTLSTILID